MKEILLTRGFVALVDDEDYEELSFGGKWSTTKGGYAQRHCRYKNGNASKELMHRIIMNLKVGCGLDVDHINGIKTDNRKINLRICTRGQNLKNQKIRKDNKSGYKGVSWNDRRKRWDAAASENGSTVKIGSFSTKELAHKAICEYRIKNHKEFANHGIGCILLEDKK